MDHIYKFSKVVDGRTFYAPSITKYKKYDVIVNGKRYSFGDYRYPHYFDKLGFYSNLNHNDDKRRKAFHNRHKNNFNFGISMSKKYLW